MDQRHGRGRGGGVLDACADADSNRVIAVTISVVFAPGTADEFVVGYDGRNATVAGIVAVRAAESVAVHVAVAVAVSIWIAVGATFWINVTAGGVGEVYLVPAAPMLTGTESWLPRSVSWSRTALRARSLSASMVGMSSRSQALSWSQQRILSASTLRSQSCSRSGSW